MLTQRSKENEAIGGGGESVVTQVFVFHRPRFLKGFCQGELCVGKLTDLQHSLSWGRRVIAGIDLCRSHMPLAEPNGWVVLVDWQGVMIAQ